MFVLAEKLADIHASLYGYGRTLTDADLTPFIQVEYSRVGASDNITPREVIRDFIELLDIIMQNPGSDVQDILQSEAFSYAKAEAEEKKDYAGGQFAEFTI